MIVEWFLGLFISIQEWFLSLFGEEGPPDWIADAADFMAELLLSVSGLGGWVPFVLLGVVAAALSSTWLVLFGIKFVRWLWGLTPFSGGS